MPRALEQALHNFARLIGSFHGTDRVRLVLAVILALFLVGYLGWPLARRWSRGVSVSRTRYAFAWTAETILLLALLAVALAWGAWVEGPFGLDRNEVLKHLGGQPSRADLLVPILQGWFPVLAGLLLLSRIRMPASLVILLSFSWAGGVCYWFYSWKDLPVSEEIHAMVSGSSTAAVLPSIMLPIALEGLRLILWAVVSFLCGIYFARRHFALWKFALGSLLGGWLLALILMPVLLTMNYWLILQPIALTLFGIVLLLAPIQRTMLERLFGFPLKHAPERVVPPQRFAAALLGHVVIVLIVVMLGCLAVSAYVNRKMIECLVAGPPQMPHDPSMQNAYPILEHRFLKPDPPAPPSAPNLPQAFKDAMFIASGAFYHILEKESWAKYDTPRLRQAIAELAPYFDDFTSAAQCDYVQVPLRGREISFLPVRETARAMHTRAMLAIHDGDTTRAIESIRPLFGFYGILRDYPNMMYEMIGVAVAGIAADACYQYWIVYHSNPAAMDQLAQLLKDERGNTYVRLNWDALRRGEPGLWEIAPFAAINTPALLRADMNTRGRNMQVQQIRVAVALEQYRNLHGRYPDRLEQLVPQYLARLPLDPYEGKAFFYEQHGGDFVLTVKYDMKPFEPPLEFPPLSVEETNKRNFRYATPNSTAAAAGRQAKGKRANGTTATQTSITTTTRAAR